MPGFKQGMEKIRGGQKKLMPLHRSMTTNVRKIGRVYYHPKKKSKGGKRQ